jgi:predicted PurR-regulated permease PerM
VVEQREFLANAIEASVRISLLLVLAAWCFDIVRPFVISIAWGIIIAVAQYRLSPTLCLVRRAQAHRGCAGVRALPP